MHPVAWMHHKAPEKGLQRKAFCATLYMTVAYYVMYGEKEEKMDILNFSKTRFKVYEDPSYTTTVLGKDFQPVKLSDVNIGDEFLLVETYSLTKHFKSNYRLIAAEAGGACGNPDLGDYSRKYHGFRSSCDDTGTWAHGVHKVVSIGEIRTSEEVEYVGLLDRIYVDKRYAIITLGEEDVHPDWD